MHPLRARLFPGIVDVLTLLKQRGARLAIVTGKGSRSMAIFLAVSRTGGLLHSQSPTVTTQGLLVNQPRIRIGYFRH